MNKTYWILPMILVTGCMTKQDNKTKELSKDSITVQNEISIKETNEVLDTLKFIKNNERAGDYWCVSTDSLKDDDLELIPPSELRLMRNEIFARYGYIFKSEDLRKHFANQKWYKPLFRNVDKYITSREKYNIEFIQKHEKINKEISQKELFDYFIEKINNREGDKIPRLISHKYGESAFANFQGIIKAEKQVFKKAKDYRFIVYNRFNGGNESPLEYRLLKFDLNGTPLDFWTLGNDLRTIEMQSDNHLYCFGIEYPDIPFDDDTTEINPEEIDTTQINIILTEKEEIIFN
jgi:hypothetical protein